MTRSQARSMFIQTIITFAFCLMARFSWDVECVTFPFRVLTLLVGRREWHSVCTKLGVGLLVVTI